MKLFSLYPDSIIFILEYWLTVKENLQLNSAFCNKKDRRKLLNLVEIKKAINISLSIPDTLLGYGLFELRIINRVLNKECSLNVKIITKSTCEQQFSILDTFRDANRLRDVGFLNKKTSIAQFCSPIYFVNASANSTPTTSIDGKFILWNIGEELYMVEKRLNYHFYSGEIQDRKCHGQGVLSSLAGAQDRWGGTYTGSFQNGQRHGHGSMKYRNGDVYAGQWKQSLPCGQGTMNYSNGGIYIGEWKHHKRCGNGSMVYPNGDVYYGEWKNDKQNGHGTMIYANGVHYDGGWINGKQYFQGQLRTAEGKMTLKSRNKSTPELREEMKKHHTI